MMICKVDNDRRHIYTYFNDVISLQDCTDMFDSVAADVQPGDEYRQINIFDRTSRLHEMDVDRIKQAQRHMAARFQAKGLVRPRSAMVSLDKLAEPVLSYWCALCDNDETVRANYRTFTNLDDACDWVGIGKDDVLDFIATSLAPR